MRTCRETTLARAMTTDDDDDEARRPSEVICNHRRRRETMSSPPTDRPTPTTSTTAIETDRARVTTHSKTPVSHDASPVMTPMMHAVVVGAAASIFVFIVSMA